MSVLCFEMYSQIHTVRFLVMQSEVSGIVSLGDVYGISLNSSLLTMWWSGQDNVGYRCTHRDADTLPFPTLPNLPQFLSLDHHFFFSDIVTFA